MTKDDLRREISARKRTGGSLDVLSKKIVKTLQRLEFFRQAKQVGVYMPLPDEVDITPLFSPLKKQFYIPAFDEASGGYRLAEYTPDLQQGKFGIPEPIAPAFAPEKLDLIIVPGIAFDRTGKRVGRGGGFYDRLLPQYRAVRAGICFDFQCLEKVPTEPHDCGVDLLVTESEFLHFATN